MRFIVRFFCKRSIEQLHDIDFNEGFYTGIVTNWIGKLEYSTLNLFRFIKEMPQILKKILLKFI